MLFELWACGADAGPQFKQHFPKRRAGRRVGRRAGNRVGVFHAYIEKKRIPWFGHRFRPTYLCKNSITR